MIFSEIYIRRQANMGFFNKLFGGNQSPGIKTAIHSSEAKNRIDGASPPFLLDVREPYEFKEGHIPGARLLPLGELESRLNELPVDREILVICRSGNRSGAATRQLIRAGYQAVNLNGGMIGWQRAGYPVKRGK
jgi:rhodanese-related sulfurtransferase